MNKTKHKFQFTIQIKRLVHPPTDAVHLEAPISVAFQRGPKLAITKTTALGAEGCEWADENMLTLMVTLYKGKAGFEPKKGKLWVRQTKMSKKREIHQGIGICEFNLSDYIGSGQVGTDVQFDLLMTSMASTEKAVIICNISSTPVTSSNDDTLSTMSGMSAMSVEGAVFEKNDSYLHFRSSSSASNGQLDDLGAIAERDMDATLEQEIDDLDPENNGPDSGSMWKKKFLQEQRYQRGIESQLVSLSWTHLHILLQHLSRKAPTAAFETVLRVVCGLGGENVCLVI